MIVNEWVWPLFIFYFSFLYSPRFWWYCTADRHSWYYWLVAVGPTPRTLSLVKLKEVWSCLVGPFEDTALYCTWLGLVWWYDESLHSWYLIVVANCPITLFPYVMSNVYYLVIGFFFLLTPILYNTLFIIGRFSKMSFLSKTLLICASFYTLLLL